MQGYYVKRHTSFSKNTFPEEMQGKWLTFHIDKQAGMGLLYTGADLLSHMNNHIRTVFWEGKNRLYTDIQLKPLRRRLEGFNMKII